MTTEQINQSLYRPIKSGSVFSAFMPDSDCSSTKLGVGDTSFAIENMAKTAQKYAHHTENLTRTFFNHSDLYQLVSNVQKFLYWHFQYAIDGEKQLLRSPACSWKSRSEGIDCKSYSIFASTILINAGVNHYMRRIKQAFNPDGFSHVYVVVPKNQKTNDLDEEYYTIDGTINISVEQELPFLEKDDVFIKAKKPQKTAKPHGLGNAEFNQSLDDLIFQANMDSKSNIAMAQEMGKQRVNAIVGAVGMATGVAGNVIGNAIAPGSGPVVQACVEAVTMLVQVFVNIFYDPCAGSFYSSEYIKQNLQSNFLVPFKAKMNYIEKELKSGTEALAISAINDVLREIDLGVFHFKSELERYANDECNFGALVGYEAFVTQVKNAVDMFLKAMEVQLSFYLETQVAEKEAFTNVRQWYMIVPGGKNPVKGRHRVLTYKVKMNKGVYPYQHTHNFSQWLQTQVAEMRVNYGDLVAKLYEREMMAYGEKIRNIRTNSALPLVTLVSIEEKYQKEQFAIYLKYDKKHQKEILDKEAKVFSDLMAQNDAFFSELKKIKELKKNKPKKKDYTLHIAGGILLTAILGAVVISK